MEPSEVGKTHPYSKPGEQDAFHVPVVLVTTNQGWVGSYHVKFTDNTYTQVVRALDGDYHGISDPWLDRVNPGDIFYVMLKPGLVTKLRHEFDLNLDAPIVAESVADYDDYDECRSCYEDDSSYNHEDLDDGCRGCY